MDARLPFRPMPAAVQSLGAWMAKPKQSRQKDDVHGSIEKYLTANDIPRVDVATPRDQVQQCRAEGVKVEPPQRLRGEPLRVEHGVVQVEAVDEVDHTVHD